MPRVTVVGAGVIGLTCAVSLAEAGFTVDVLARELPQETSSAAGTGLWWPWPLEPAGPATRWARATLRALRDLAGRPDTGVAVRSGHLLGAPNGPLPPELADDVPLGPAPGPSPGPERGLRASLPVMHLERYLPYLVARLREADGTLTRMALPALPTRGTVVNCSGVAARALAADPAVRPARAQSVWLADPGLDAWWHQGDPASACTVVPHGRHVVVAGSVLDGDWSSTPDVATADDLRERAARLVPALRGAAVLGHRVSVQGARPAVRLEAQRDPGRTLVHCYGHGPAAHTLAWGCADDVVDAVRSSF